MNQNKKTKPTIRERLSGVGKINLLYKQITYSVTIKSVVEKPGEKETRLRYITETFPRFSRIDTFPNWLHTEIAILDSRFEYDVVSLPISTMIDRQLF